MKKPRKIKLKRLMSSLQKKYGSSELFTMLLPYAEGMRNESGSIKYPSFFEAVKKSVSPSFLTEPSAIAEAMGNDFSYRQLSHFYGYAVINALIGLDLPIPSEELLCKTVDYFKALFSLSPDELYPHLSEAERILSESIYFKDCDDSTKDALRSKVLACSKKLSLSEAEAAALFLRRDPFEHRPSAASRLYFPTLISVTAAFSALSFFVTKNLAVFLFLILPVSEGAKQITDFIFSHIVKTCPIPKKKLENIPEDAKTLTVITSLLTGGESDRALTEKIRNCYFANRDKGAFFGLLCDLKESASSTHPFDVEIERAISDAVSEMNKKYGCNIILFVRSRRYAFTEDKYMGWERKRGAVIELTRFLKGEQTSLRVLEGDVSVLTDVRYVITLDSDTRLYTGAVKDLLGAMLHPSNKPIIKDGAVRRGYAILQPRMEASLSSAEKTPFAVLSAGNGGSDIYATAAYETYQSVFGEGIFCGKGIFDLDAFVTLIDGAFPDGAVLSHDLLEGSRLRAGAVTDISLTDDLPKSPLSCFDRSHRWIRGDVQALTFAGKYSRDSDGVLRPNPISALSKFKIYDNIRRALVPVSAVCALLLCIFRPSYLSPLIALFALSYLFIPFILSLYTAIKSAKRRFFSYLIPECFSSLLYLLYSVASLLHTAISSADAVLRAGFRMLFSGKKLLQWRTASESESGIKGLPLYIYRMLPSLLTGVALFIFCPKAPLKMLGVLFAAFPFAAYRIGKPFPSSEPISDRDKKKLLGYSRDMWRFFSERVTDEENHLPPDNVQLSPDERTAHRTSPTNIGLYLLSCAAAYKLDIISENEMLSRIKNTLNTLDSMPKWHGHLYNWYDTENLFILGSPYVSTVDSGNFITCLIALKAILEEGDNTCRRKTELIGRIDAMIEEADFSCLYHKKKKLMLIGVNTEKEDPDPPCYDFFTSEARTTSFFAIASGQVPREHWRYLRRVPVSKDGYSGLYSWTGTMFEYFMPTLLLPSRQGSLSFEALSFALREQKRAAAKGVWGRSESGYFDFDRDLNYQYKAFGVSSLGMKADLDKETVISPYSTFLSLPFGVGHALDNLKRLSGRGMYGIYGFYEAMDMTPSRVGKGYAIIKSYMSHHVGMSLVACANACLDNAFVRAFMSDPRCASASELLEEKVPKSLKAIKRKRIKDQKDDVRGRLPRFNLNDQKRGSNITSAALISENGLCASVLGDTLRLSALKGDISIDPFLFGRIYRPRLILSADGIPYDLLNGKIKGGNDKGRISWLSDNRRFTSEASLSILGQCKSFVFSVSAEGHFEKICPMLVLFPSLCAGRERLSHPSYADLEVCSEYSERDSALIFYKKNRRAEEGEKCFALSLESKGGGEEFITVRSHLHSMYTEKDIESLINSPFDNRTGTLIDPFCAVRKTSAASGRYVCNIVISVGNSKSEALYYLNSARGVLKSGKGKNGAYIAEKYLMRSQSERLSALSDPRLREIIGTVLSSVLTGKRKEIPNGSYKIDDFYKHGISGDLPIMCITLDDDLRSSSPVIKWLELFISCHKYLALSGIKLDTVILYDSGGEYMSVKREAIYSAAERCASGFLIRGGGIYEIDGFENRDLFENCACVLAVIDKSFTLEGFVQKNRMHLDIPAVPIRRISNRDNGINTERSGTVRVHGGFFDQDGFTVLKDEKIKEAPPDSYVYAFFHFGTLVTDSSLGYTWIANSHERRITPFCPDNRLHMNGELLIATVKDTEYDLIACSHTAFFGRGGATWIGNAGPIGYTVTASVDPFLPCKIVTVTYSGNCEIKTEYRITPVLGDVPRRNRPIKTVNDGDVTRYIPTVTDGKGDIGFIYQRQYSDTVCFLLGAYPYGKEKVLDTILKKYGTKSAFFDCEREYKRRMASMLPKLKCHFPDKYLSVMTEYYLPYQTLVCRFFGRTGFYQSGGAFGFRDQLQDCLCIMLSAPDTARTHILRCACHQYEEGDVMHWWHTLRGISRGVRTRYTDDLLWLPYVTARYIEFTGDDGILDIELPYLSSPPLNERENDRYECPQKSKYRDTLYFHCVKAIERSLNFGAHGLPLMGGGDWNDGMNDVGKNGGESVWLGFFLVCVLNSFAPLAVREGDISGAAKYRRIRDELLSACEKCFDDGRYLRAFFGDGAHLGNENFVDLLPQAFSVFASADEKRSKSALKLAYDTLFDPENAVFALLYPPFDRPDTHDPGYIASYPPGIRENGGQYTHAAVWAAMAMNFCGMKDEAAEALTVINPAKICSTYEGAKRYKGEAYFLAGDVSCAPDLRGKCGWSLYTGSAGWYFNAVFACIMGIVITDDSFTVSPSLSTSLPFLSFTFGYKDTVYEITVKKGKKKEYLLDGKNANNLFYFDKNYHLLEITVEILPEME